MQHYSLNILERFAKDTDQFLIEVIVYSVGDTSYVMCTTKQHFKMTISTQSDRVFKKSLDNKYSDM